MPKASRERARSPSAEGASPGPDSWEQMRESAETAGALRPSSQDVSQRCAVVSLLVGGVGDADDGAFVAGRAAVDIGDVDGEANRYAVELAIVSDIENHQA